MSNVPISPNSHHRDLYKEIGAFIVTGLETDIAVVRFDYFLANGKPQPASGGFGCKVGFKNPIPDLWWNATAIVADLNDR